MGGQRSSENGLTGFQAIDRAGRPAPPPPRKAPLKLAVPVFLLLGIWVLGGLISWNLAEAYGWRQTSHPLRSGTMRVERCDRDAWRLFVTLRCRGPVEFAAESSWSAAHRDDLRRRADVTLVSRSDLTGRTVHFTSHNLKDEPRGKDRGKILRSDAPIEVAYPDEQRRTSLSGATLWVPLGAILATALGGVLACAVGLRVLVVPELRRRRGGRAATPGQGNRGS